MPARLQSLFVALVLLAGIGSPGTIAYRCSITKEIHNECCCKHESGPTPRITNDACCTIIRADVDLPPVHQPVEAKHLTLATAPVVLAFNDPRPLDATSISTAAPPERPPPVDPVFRLHCAYLI